MTDEEQDKFENLLAAVMLAYKKHVLDDPSIGWDELVNILKCSLCEALGDKGFQNFLKECSK